MLSHACFLDDLNTTIDILPDLTSGEPKDAPSMNGEKVLPFTVSGKVPLVFSMPLPTINLDGQTYSR